MIAGLCLSWAGFALRAEAQGGAERPADVAAIRSASAAYREALSKGDVAAVRAAWTADGDIVDGRGNRILPQDAEALVEPAGDAGAERPEFRAGESRLRFLSDDVAVEDGTVDVVLPGTTIPVEGWFSALWVRRVEGWKLAGLRESENPVAPDAEMLDDLEWMVGEWALDAADGPDDAAPAPRPSMEMAVRWDAGRSFLVREAKGTGDDGTIEVHQRIGWDPLVRRIRSWTFSSDGSRGEATWFRDGMSWVAVNTVVLPGGRQQTTVNIYTPEGPDRFVWRTLPEATDTDEGTPTRATWTRISRGDER